jgi:SlyX protein
MELEIRYAHLERLVGELSTLAYQQQRQLDSLQALFGQLHLKLKAHEPGLVDASQQEKPPHY